MDRNTRRLISAALPALCQPPPDVTEYLQLVIGVVISLIRTPPSPLLDIRNRLFSEDVNVYEGRDLFRILSENRFQFFQITGETPERFIQLVNFINISSLRGHKLSNRNRCLLILLWLRLYPSYHLLSALFNVGVSTIYNELRCLIPLFEEKLTGFVKWPTMEEWRSMKGQWEKIPCAVGAIDGTSQEIRRPSNEPQEQYYSGYRHFHSLHTQVIVDCEGNIVYVSSGYLGHMNDAQQYVLMRRIGVDIEFPPECSLLGDKFYPNRNPLLAPFSTAQLARKGDRERRKCRKFNRYVRLYRVCVEHAVGELKCYKVLSTVWRHPRHLLSGIVKLCAELVSRRKQIGLIH